MNEVIYQFHKIIISEYNNLYKLLIFIIIYLFFYPINSVLCMNGSSSSSNFNLIGLLTERNNLYEQLNLLSQENTMLSNMVQTLQKEKAEILTQTEFMLETERLQSTAYKQTLDSLQTQHNIVQQELHEARQTIEALTNDLLDQKITLLSQQQIVEPSQASQPLPKKREFVEDLLAGFLSEEENVTKKQK